MSTILLILNCQLSHLPNMAWLLNLSLFYVCRTVAVIVYLFLICLSYLRHFKIAFTLHFLLYLSLLPLIGEIKTIKTSEMKLRRKLSNLRPCNTRMHFAVIAVVQRRRGLSHSSD